MNKQRRVVPQDEFIMEIYGEESSKNYQNEQSERSDQISVGQTEIQLDNVNQRNEEALQFLHLNRQNSSKIKYISLQIKSPYYGFIFLRKFVKICICQSIILIFVALLIASWFVSYQYSDYTTNSAQIMKLQMGNCLANLYSHDGQNIIVNYRILGSLISFLNSDGTFMRYKDFQQTNSNVEFYFQNSYSDVFFHSNQITQCILDVTLPKQLQSITFQCLNQTQCIIVQHSDSLSLTQDLNFISPDSSSMQINIKNVQTNTLNISNLGGGAIYLNNIIADTGYIESFNGPIVVQSTNDFKVQFTTSISAFCFSAPTQGSIAYQSCYMNSSTQDLKNSTCTGTINQCSSSLCNPSNSYIIKTQSGSIYANRIYQVGYPYNNTQITQSGIFSESIQLDQNSIDKIYQAGNSTFSGADLALKFNVGGNYLLQQSSNSFWIYFSNSAYAQFRPWFLSTLSAGVIKPQQRSVDVQLQPGFCPFSQFQTPTQLFTIKEKLLEYSPYYYGSTQIYLMLKQFQDVPNSYNQYNFSDGISELDSSDYYMRDRWYVLQKDQSQVSITPIEYQGIFIAALFFSFLSALVFAFIGTYVIKSYLRVLQKSAYQIAAQYLQYTTTAFTADIGEANRQLQLQKEEATKKILEESKIPTESMEVPQIFSLMSYYLYLQVQRIQLVFNPIKIFFKCLMIPTTPNFNEINTEMSYADLKNRYEKFCYLNHMPIQQLKEGRDWVLKYNYDIIKDAEENISYLAKLKENSISQKKNLIELTEQEKSQASLYDLYVQNNYTITGIAADTIRLSQFKENYKLFCGRNDELSAAQIEEIIRNYRLIQTNQLEYKLTPIDKNNNYYSLSYNDSYIEFIMNPQEIAEQIKVSFSGAIKESIKYNFTKLKKLIWSDSQYTHEDPKTLDIFNVLYMDGWFYGEFLIIMGELCFIFITIIPIIYLIVIINTSYSDYSQINPKELLTTTDMLLRPFQFFIYFKYMKIYYIIVMVPIFYYIYGVIINLFYLFTSGLYPQDYEFVEGTRKNMQGRQFLWYLFLAIFYYNLFYIGNVVVWVILGAIINPNNFLVYASSAATIIATITDQYNTLVQIYESGKSQVQSYIFKYFLQTVTNISGVLMKETEKIADQTAQILTSSGMKLSQAQAKEIGFEDNLQKLCSSMQNLTDQIDLQSFNLDNQKRQFEEIKYKFLTEISEKFKKKLEDFGINQDFAHIIADFIFFRQNITNQEFLLRLLNQDYVNKKIRLNENDRIMQTIITTIFEIYEIVQKNDGKTVIYSRIQSQLKLLLSEIVKSFKHMIIPQDMMQYYYQIDQDGFTDQIINLLIECLDITKVNELSLEKQFEYYEEIFTMGLNIWKQQLQNEPEKVVLLNQFDMILLVIQVIKIKVMRPDDEEDQMFVKIQKLIELKKDQIPELQQFTSIFNILFLPYSTNNKFNDGNNTKLMIENFMKDIKPISNNFQAKIRSKEENLSGGQLKDENQENQKQQEIFEEIFKKMLEFAMKVMKFEQLDYQVLSDLIKYFTKFEGDVVEKDQNILIQTVQGILYLGLREWNQFYKSILPQKQYIQEMVIDCIFIGSEFIWTQTHLDQYSEINNQYQGNNQDSDYEYSNYNSNILNEDDLLIEDSNEIQSESGSGDKLNQKQNKFIHREQKLKNRYLVNLIAKSFNMQESEIIGLIQIIRPTESSFFNMADNQFITLLSQKYKRENARQNILYIMKVMSCKNFLLIDSYIKYYFNKEIYQQFQDIYKNELLKDLFQYKSGGNKKDPIQEYTNEFERKKDKKLKQFINNHQSNQFSFFTFLKNFNLRFNFGQNKDINKQVEKLFNLFWEQIQDHQLVGIMQLLLTIQSQLNYQSQINLNFEIIKYLHIDENQFKNLLNIIQFQDQDQISKSIQYFLDRQKQKSYLESFNHQASIFQKAILQVIKIEQVLNQIIYKTLVNTFIPYQFMLLKPLFFREILNCQQPEQRTDWLRICLNELSEGNRNEYKQLSLEVALIDDIDIKQKKAKEIVDLLKNQNQIINNGIVWFYSQKSTEEKQFYDLEIDDPISAIKSKANDLNKKISNIYQFYEIVYKNYNLVSNFCNQPLMFQKHWDGLLMSKHPELHVYQNQKVFHAFLSIFQRQPDYKTLKSFCDINTLKAQKFIAYMMFQKNKQQVIHDFYGDIENIYKLPQADLETIIKMLDGKLDFDRILEENKNEFVRDLIKFYLALNNNHFKGLNYESNMKQEQQCRQIKQSFLKAHVNSQITEEEYNLFDFLNWVQNPDPISLFFKTEFDPILLNLLNLGNLNSSTKIIDAAAPIIINIIISIIKFDPHDIFLNISNLELFRHQEWIEKNRNKPLYILLQYIQQLDQNLIKCFVLLSALTGIDINLINIFFLNKNNLVKEFFETISSDQKYFFFKISAQQGQSGEFLQKMEVEKWDIIEYIIKGQTQKIIGDQQKHLELINKLYFTSLSDKIETPKFTLFCILRYMRKLRNLKYKYNKYCAQILYIKHAHCIDMILKGFETFLFLFNYQQYETFNKNLIGELILNGVYKIVNQDNQNPLYSGQHKFLNFELLRTPIQINPLWLVNDDMYGQFQKQNQIMKLKFIYDFVKGKITNTQMFQQQDFTRVQVQNVSLLKQIQSIVNKGSSLEAWSKLVRSINTSSSQDFRFSHLKGSLESWQIMDFNDYYSSEQGINNLGNLVTEYDPKCILDEQYNEAYLNFYNQNKKTFDYIKRIHNFKHECLGLIGIENKAQSLKNLTIKIKQAKEKKYQDGDVYFQKAYYEFCVLYTQYCYQEVIEFNNESTQQIKEDNIQGSKQFLKCFFNEIIPLVKLKEKQKKQQQYEYNEQQEQQKKQKEPEIKFITMDQLLSSYKRISQLQTGSEFILMIARAVLFKKYKTPVDFIIPNLFQINEKIDLKSSQGFLMLLLIRFQIENQNDTILNYQKLYRGYKFSHFMATSDEMKNNSQKIGNILLNIKVNYLVKFFNQNCNKLNSSDKNFQDYVIILNNLILAFLGGINNFIFLLQNVRVKNDQINNIEQIGKRELIFIQSLLQKIKQKQGYFKCEQKDLELPLLQFMKEKNIKIIKIVNAVILENKAQLELNNMSESDFKQIATLAETLLEKNFKNIEITLKNCQFLQDISNLTNLKEFLKLNSELIVNKSEQIKNERLQKLFEDVMTDPYPQIIQSFLAWFNLSSFKELTKEKLKILTDKILLYPIKQLFNQQTQNLTKEEEAEFYEQLPEQLGKEVVSFDLIHKIYECFKESYQFKLVENENYAQILKLIGYKYLKQGVGENYLSTQHYIPNILIEYNIVEKVFEIPGQKKRQFNFINLFVEQINLETLHAKVFDQSGIPIIQCMIDHLIPVNEQKQDNQQFILNLLDTLFKIDNFSKNDSVKQFLEQNQQYQQCFMIGTKAENIVDSILKIKLLLQDMQKQFTYSNNQIKFQDIVDSFKQIIELVADQNQAKKSSKLIQYINAIQSIIEFKFDNIDILLFDQVSSKTGELSQIINNFQNSLKEPFKLISTKQNAFQNTTVSQEAQYLSGIAMKIKDGQQLTFDDIFRILTKNPLTLKISYDDFVTFLKRIGIELTEHKLHEILVAAVGTEFTDINSFQMDINQYTKAMQLIIIHTMEQALHFLGISQELLVQSLMVVLTYLILFIAFILIGIQAFAIPGTFGSIINSLFPALGGLGLRTDSKNKREFLLEEKKVQECVDRAIQIIQTLRF